MTLERLIEKLQALLKGCRITGIEPIDYPVTDGILIYLTRDGRQYILGVGYDCWEEEDGNPFYLRIDQIRKDAPEDPETRPVYGRRLFTLQTR